MDYKERLEEAKRLYETATPDQKYVLESLFPELKESEDEKIRKYLLKLADRCPEDSIDFMRGVKKGDIIAWLEKQGGTSKEWTISDAATFKELIDFLENGTAKLQHDLTRYANWLKIQFTPIEKQKKEEEMVHIAECKVWPANSATTANRQLYNRAILKILSNYVEKYPDIRFGQMLYNLGVNPHFNEESRETYCNLNETINKQKS